MWLYGELLYFLRKLKQDCFAEPPELQGQDIIIASEFPNNVYKVKTSTNLYEEDDLNIDCVEYAEGITYETCVEVEFVRKIQNMLICTPPWWIATDEQKVCKDKLNVPEDIQEKFKSQIISD